MLVLFDSLAVLQSSPKLIFCVSGSHLAAGEKDGEESDLPFREMAGPIM